jgi:hypothetical protein
MGFPNNLSYLRGGMNPLSPHVPAAHPIGQRRGRTHLIENDLGQHRRWHLLAVAGFREPPHSGFVIINKKLLDSLANVDLVSVNKKPYFDPFGPFRIDDGYLKKHKNIILFGDKIDFEHDANAVEKLTLWEKKNIPEKYQSDKIFSLFGLDDGGFSLKTGEYVTWS